MRSEPYGGRGRPPKNSKDRRYNVLASRFSDEEFEQFAEIAHRKQMTRAQLLREIVSEFNKENQDEE